MRATSWSVQLVEGVGVVEVVGEGVGVVGGAAVEAVGEVAGEVAGEVPTDPEVDEGPDTVAAVVETSRPPVRSPPVSPPVQAARASRPVAARARPQARPGRRASAGSVVSMSMHAIANGPGQPSTKHRARRPVVLDVDTGVDDACAILLAAGHPAIDLRAVSCVGGNASIDDVVANTLTVLDAAGRADVPVARGAERPLLEPVADARHVHGEDGMGDLDWPRSGRSADPRHAVELLRDVLLAAGAAGEQVTVVPLGPLTNIALLLRTYPLVARGVREILFMGGAVNVGNATASAEFNVFHDPEAAAMTLDAAADLGIPVTMYGLDVFYGPQITRAEAEELISRGDGGSGELAGRLIQFQCDRFTKDDATIGDAGAVCAVIDREAMTTRRLPVRVELAGSWSRGRTIVDRRDWSGDLDHDPHGLAPSTIDVALDVDGERYRRLWLDTVSGR